MSSLGHCLYGVHYQIGEDLLDLRGVDGNPARLTAGDNLKIDLPGAGQLLQESADLVRQVNHVYRGALGGAGACIVEELLDEHLEAGADLQDAEYGPFSGVSVCYDDDEEFWCEWYLLAGPVMLYITYNCPLDSEGEEEDVIESIMESLTLNQATG